MNDMPFEPAGFDAIWSEGAIYFLGFETGLARVKDLVRPGGYVAVSEAVWLQPGPPMRFVTGIDRDQGEPRTLCTIVSSSGR